ncbi:MAG: hypothetical protein P1U41_03680 [Vicingaceae bacterium]|nr:hypothetical protein [Vicingaceae bacterium]
MDKQFQVKSLKQHLNWITFFLMLLPIYSTSQIVDEKIQLDTISESIQVIYRPTVTNPSTHYSKKVAVFASDTSQIAIEKTYLKGVKNGIYKVYYPTGRLKVKTVFANDKINGEWTWYDKEGIILVKGIYVNNIKHGYWAYKHLKIYGRYKNGKRNKMWYTPDANNKKVKSQYKNGLLVKGDGFGDLKIELTPDTVYQKEDTTIVESTVPVKTEVTVVEKHFEQALDFLAHNALFRKTIKEFYKKDIQKYKKNYKQDVFQFKIAEVTPKMEINSFLKQSEEGKIQVAVIDYILKNEAEKLKESFNVLDVVTDKNIIKKASKNEAESTVYFSGYHNNLLRIDVVWSPTKEVKTEVTTFKVLLYFDDNGVLKGAEYQKF